MNMHSSVYIILFNMVHLFQIVSNLIDKRCISEKTSYDLISYEALLLII